MNLLYRSLAVLIAGGIVPEDRRERAVATDTIAAATPAVHLSAVGSAGCSASNCHGGQSSPDEKNRWQSSYRKWAGYDKHAQAYDVLNDQRSKEIVWNWSRHETRDATSQWQCLACHSNPALAKAEPGNKQLQHLQSEGVSCEACHGNASTYLYAHTGWKPGEPDRAGLADLNNLDRRADMCMGCHVGAPARDGIPLRDVTHDMIAAGHPRLNFEMATYSRLMPAHWHERDRGKDFDAKLWAVGQDAHVVASLKLLQARLEPDAKERWPEFAEFHCYACHHNLQPGAATPQGVGGRLIWNRPGIIATSSRFQPNLDAVKTLLVSDTLSPAAVSEQIDNIGVLRRDNTVKPADRLKLTEEEWQRLDWDQAARLYMAGMALAGSRINEPDIAAAIKSLREKLLFDKSSNSPKKFDAVKVGEELKQFIEMVTAR